MEIEILDTKENKLLERKEIRFKINYDKGTPKINEVREKLLSAVSSNKDLTVVENIDQKFGMKNAVCYAKVYDNEKAMKVELRPTIKKNFGAETADKLLGVKKKKVKEKKKKEVKK